MLGLQRKIKRIMVCPRCGCEAKFIRAGVSRSGRSYRAFYTCQPHDGKPPCFERGRDDRLHELRWSSERQWEYLHGEPRKRSNKRDRPPKGRVRFVS